MYNTQYEKEVNIMDLSIDFYIIKVHYHINNDYIEKVKCVTNLSDTSEYDKSREEVVKDINIFKKKIFTATESYIGRIKGAKVITEIVNDIYYIKTVPDKTKRDNLDELPKY